MPPTGPNSANPYDAILKAVEAKSLTIGNLIHYLQMYYDVDGVRDFLINQLYDQSKKDASFYLPELVYASVYLAICTTQSLRRAYTDI